MHVFCFIAFFFFFAFVEAEYSVIVSKGYNRFFRPFFVIQLLLITLHGK